ncbi:MAG: hypothetical protein HHAS10_08450 [Candidatus Altimarinota bacterium]
MKHSSLLVVLVASFLTLFAGISLVSAISVRTVEAVKEEAFTGIEYPEGESFVRLKQLIDETFTVQKTKSRYSYGFYGTYPSCISDRWLCTNYKYTSLTEKSIKYIILETYVGNENFYRNLFRFSSSYSSYGDDTYGGTSSGNSKSQVAEILKLVPVGKSVLAPVSNIFSQKSTYSYYNPSSNIGANLLSSSFGVDFTENSSQNTMLGAIEQKIKDMKRSKCQKEIQSQNYNAINSKCPWTGEISNRYLPTLEELLGENIYYNGRSVSIKNIKDQFEYSISGSISVIDREVTQYDYNKNIMPFYDNLPGEGEVFSGGSGEAPGVKRVASNMSFLESKGISLVASPSIAKSNELLDLVNQELMYSHDESTKAYLNALKEMGTYYINEFQKDTLLEPTYTLRLLKNSYTLEEAKAELEKKQSETDTIFRGSSGILGQLPCILEGSYIVRSQCAAARANMNTVMTALGAYYSDRETYPDTLEALNTNYLPKQQVLEDFKKNFSYRSISGTTSSSNDYEIVYIGKIGEGSLSTSDKPDYNLLLSGAQVPEIPAIFSRAPSDSVVLYVKNPQNLFALLETKSNTSTRLSGMDVSQSVKQTIQDFFELKDFSTLEENLEHEALLVIENLDFSAPDVTLILSEEDRAALSPSAKARVVGSKDGFIYVSSSKSTIDRFMDLPEGKSLSESPDFRYVWTKKSGLIKDAYMFVGDAFFERMLTLETYITHYRKLRDVERLSKLQELVWSYQDAYGKLPKNLDELISQFDAEGKLKPFISDFSITEDGRVVHKNIGAIGSIKTIPEINYDISTISQSELDDYKTNVLKYRDTWRASLDPMGIVMNRYGDGIEVDFFMTPIPKLDGDFKDIQDIFEGATKESFDYLNNQKLRLGILTLVAGFDPKKLQNKAAEIKDFGQGLEQTNAELLDGKNIFDYIGGEGAFTLGNIPSDILDGWNVEKIDAHFAIEFVSKEKGKEFIDIVRKKFLSRYESASDGYFDMKSFFAKPLIEDYQGEQIYYIEAIPVPFVGKIGFAYTFIDNFFFIGLNRTSMRHVIDVANSGDDARKTLLDGSTVLENSFFVGLLDGITASSDLKGLYEKNRTSIPRYASLLDKNDSGLQGLNQILSSYHVSYTRSKRLGIDSKPFDFTLGGLSIKEIDGDLWVRIDESLQNDLSGTTLQLWENISSDERFPRALVGDMGIKIQEFLMNPMKSEILAFELIVKLDHAFEGNESLLRNSTFSLSVNENEIGFLSRVFRERDTHGNTGETKGIFSGINSAYIIGGGVFIVLVIILGGGFLLYSRKKNIGLNKNNPSNSQASPGSSLANYSLPPGIIIGDEQSVLIKPTATPTISEIVQSVDQASSSGEIAINTSQSPTTGESGNNSLPSQS